MTQSKQTYQQLREELDRILHELQQEDTDVDKALKLHEDGQDVLKQLEDYLGEVAEKQNNKK